MALVLLICKYTFKWRDDALIDRPGQLSLCSGIVSTDRSLGPLVRTSGTFLADALKESTSHSVLSRRAEGPSMRPLGRRRPAVCHATEPASSPLDEANPRLEARTSMMVRTS
jgi:hypothetical protein